MCRRTEDGVFCYWHCFWSCQVKNKIRQEPPHRLIRDNDCWILKGDKKSLRVFSAGNTNKTATQTYNGKTIPDSHRATAGVLETKTMARDGNAKTDNDKGITKITGSKSTESGRHKDNTVTTGHAASTTTDEGKEDIKDKTETNSTKGATSDISGSTNTDAESSKKYQGSENKNTSRNNDNTESEATSSRKQSTLPPLKSKAETEKLMKSQGISAFSFIWANMNNDVPVETAAIFLLSNQPLKRATNAWIVRYTFDVCFYQTSQMRLIKKTTFNAWYEEQAFYHLLKSIILTYCNPSIKLLFFLQNVSLTHVIVSVCLTKRPF